MGTKANPGKFDCYASLAPDEPYFLLKGSDTMAAPLVQLWSLARLLRIGGPEWDDAIDALVHAAEAKGPYNFNKVMEAQACALTMQHYACGANGGHDRQDTGTPRERARGLRRGECRKCGMDMTEDSSD